MKKKLWCVLCIMICMMMIAACGQKENPEKKKSEKAEQEETEFKDRESLKLSLFTVYYPKAWNYDKENMKKDEEYSYVRFFDGDTVDGCIEGREFIIALPESFVEYKADDQF